MLHVQLNSDDRDLVMYLEKQLILGGVTRLTWFCKFNVELSFKKLKPFFR